MRKSIHFRNFCATAVIMLLGFSVLGCMFVVWSYRLVMSEKREAMSAALEDSVEYLSALSRDTDFALDGLNLRMTLSAISSITGFDILLADAEGTVVLCSDRNFFCSHIGKTVPSAARAAAASSGGYNELTDLGRVYSEKRYVVCRPLYVQHNAGTAIIGYILISGDASSMVYIWRQFAGIFLLIAVAVMFLTFIISIVTTKRQTAPLKEMASAAQRFARGDFAVRVRPSRRQDEIGQLTSAFNAMADSLQSSEALRREFIANISHELKTPMTVIAGFADGILDGTIPPENEARYLGIISSETMRLSRLVKSMLDLSKIQSADAMEILQNSFDISEIVRLALLSLGSKIDSRGLDVAPELPEEPVIVLGDKDAITQVVYNLIDNAIKFSSPDATVRIALWKQGLRAFVSVENSGDTIPEDEMPLIFDRFHKADKARSADREGVGLGLYIVKTILDNHNEDIFVTSRDGVTKFVFTLTIAQ